jgi:hypothetical protein
MVGRCVVTATGSLTQERCGGARSPAPATRAAMPQPSDPARVDVSFINIRTHMAGLRTRRHVSAAQQAENVGAWKSASAPARRPRRSELRSRRSAIPQQCALLHRARDWCRCGRGHRPSTLGIVTTLQRGCTCARIQMATATWTRTRTLTHPATDTPRTQMSASKVAVVARSVLCKHGQLGALRRRCCAGSNPLFRLRVHRRIPAAALPCPRSS